MLQPQLTRRDLLRLAALAGGGAAAGGVLSACGADGTAPASADIAPNAKITFASTTITNSLDPHAALSNTGRSYAVQVYDTLVQFAPDGGGFAPGLATAWKRVDDTTLELTLREGVTFHEGGAFDAAAVVANIERLTGDSSGKLTQVKGFLGTVTKASAVDARTVRITTGAPDPILLNRLTRVDIVDPSIFASSTQKASGTGPFRVTGYTPAQKIELERYAKSWRSSDRVATATLQAISDPNTLASALRSGEVDIAFGLGPTQAEQMRSSFGIKATSAGSCAICSMIPAVEPKLADPRVREAINLAVNRDEFVAAGLAGYGRPSTGQLLQPGFQGYDSSFGPLPHDIAKAKQLLKDAGAENLRLDIATTAIFKSQAETVAGYLGAVGIKSEVQLQELSAFISTLLKNSTVPLLYWQTDYFDLRDIASVSRFGPQAAGVQRHFENDEYPALYTQANKEMDATKREALIKQMAKLLREQYGVLFLAWPDLVYVHSKKLVEVGLTGNSLVRLESIGKTA
ncbi:ABC transporter substrate-binding protein [Dactylosporangium sp. AC04546]|uniref:ABC transporter substrate-binding protein n=1 Tax=Dactylosporangium sp. AC04546 TaxID=2862460 RepID=UPI001EDD217D|nr:ABC transporter substrate-binding protein [Dactylosporangium sp. AC04546]WVK78444.1 ABC transporter substrate-binding protein [Dactylosporangium sp. AC04546]